MAPNLPRAPVSSGDLGMGVWEAAEPAGKGARMIQAPYLMGIDFGTGGVRVGLFDREGSPAVFSAVELTTRHPRAGWAEQDPGEWWSALARATRGALAERGVAAAESAGLSVDATASTVVATDTDGGHLRPAIMWMDVRAADQARRIQETGAPALKYNGFGAVPPGLGLPKALWLKENEPETWNGAARVVDCADWAIQRLTGEAATSI